MDSKDNERAGGEDQLKGVIRNVIEEFLAADRHRSEPAYKTELTEEKKRRETLERRVNELVDENQKSRKMAEEAERHGAIRSELMKLGVGKVELAFKVVKDDIRRAEDGNLIARGKDGEVGVRDYLERFVTDNPEFLPARIAGGAGLTGPQKSGYGPAAVDLDQIRPGMSPEDLQRVREQISQVASRTLKGE
jgi:hypothetical protein